MSENEKLMYTYKIAAKIVTKYGKAYLPVFQRLHSEIQKMETKADLMSLASQIQND